MALGDEGKGGDLKLPASRLVSAWIAIVAASMLVAPYQAAAVCGQTPVAQSGPYITWFLAEGSTGPGFDTFVLIQNPGSEAAAVDITYQTPGGEVPGPHLSIEPFTRQTINVSGTVRNEDSVSTKVTSDKLVVVERSMYFSTDDVLRQAAHNSIGVTLPSNTWYLAEGSTGSDARGTFETWILVQNPGDEKAEVDLTYQTLTEEVKGPHLTLQPGTRQSVNVADTVKNQDGVSTMVSSDMPVIAERSMYWSDSYVRRQCAHDSIGVYAPSTTWYLAEGSTASESRGSFETWVLVQNPGDSVAQVEIEYQTLKGEAKGPILSLQPHTRQSVNVADTVKDEWDVSTMVTSDRPVIAERSMYWSTTDGIFRQAAHDSIGVTSPELEWWLAEGSTGEDETGVFETWVLVQNPGEEPADVQLEYMTPDAPVPGPGFRLEGKTRRSFNIADTVPGNWNVSTRIESDRPIIAERSVYYNVEGPLPYQYHRCAHDSIGYSCTGAARRRPAGPRVTGRE